MKRGTAKGLWKGGKDFVVGVYDTFAYPEETLEAMYYAGRYPKETASAAKEQITKAYERVI